jgi:hypothetical protein
MSYSKGIAKSQKKYLPLPTSIEQSYHRIFMLGKNAASIKKECLISTYLIPPDVFCQRFIANIFQLLALCSPVERPLSVWY